jgi:esterase/lipase superfamily enzyme
MWSTVIAGRFARVHGVLTPCISIIFLLYFLSPLLGLPVNSAVADQSPTRIRSSIPKGLQVYFATSRLNDGSRSSPEYSGARHFDLGSGSLEYGTAALRTPNNIVGPNAAKTGPQYRDLLKLDTDMWRTAKVNFIGGFDEDDLMQKVHNCTGKVCVYVHGYDKPFLEALQDASMLFADYLQFNDDKHQLVPILFSWPSAGGRSKYSVDEANIEWSKQAFNHFMDRVVKEKNPDATLEIIGHSMGNRLIVSYLNEHVDSKTPFINNLFLCSADVDFHTVEAAKAKLEAAVNKMIYITVSDKDRPLIMSQYMHGEPRLGRPIDPPGPPPPSENPTPNTKPNPGDFWVQLGLEAAEFWFGPTCTDTPDVLGWLAQNPNLDQEFGERCRLLDVTDISIHTMGHGMPWSVVSSIMAGYLDFPQLRGRAVHKRPDKQYLVQCGGKPRVLYRYIRLDPF